MRAMVLAFLLLTGCDSILGPEIPEGATPYDPLPAYAEWWGEVQHDAGITGSLARVRFYEVQSGPWWSDRYNRIVHGIWLSDGRIYIAAGFTDHENLIKHEMLHELLNESFDGDREHLHPLFRRYTLVETRS